MGIYESLGIRPVINASATLTRLGGSLMPPEVIQAMNEAAVCFIDMEEFQRRVGERIAELTHNEAAYVSSGAAAGLVLATAACITGDDAALIHRFPHLDGLKHEVLVHKSHRNGYDYTIQQIGAKIIDVGQPGQTTLADFEAAITDMTVAIFWFQGAMTSADDVPLADLIRLGNAHDIPVIVDAAAQLPPASNLWNFTHAGAALAIFSGGKDLRGPQSSGLVLGRKDLVEACRKHGCPNPNVGRPMKVGKEELAGVLAAVERYVNLDPAVLEQYSEATVTSWCDALSGIDGVTAQRSFPNEACQPLPRCHIIIDTEQLGLSSNDVMEQLRTGTPAIIVASDGDTGIFVNPMTLEAGEDQIVQQRLVEILKH